MKDKKTLTIGELENRICSILEEKFFSDNVEDSADQKLADGHGLDSLDCVELVMELEKQLDISINDDLVDNWSNMTPKEIALQIHHLVS